MKKLIYIATMLASTQSAFAVDPDPCGIVDANKNTNDHAYYLNSGRMSFDKKSKAELEGSNKGYRVVSDFFQATFIVTSSGGRLSLEYLDLNSPRFGHDYSQLYTKILRTTPERVEGAVTLRQFIHSLPTCAEASKIIADAKTQVELARIATKKASDEKLILSGKMARSCGLSGTVADRIANCANQEHAKRGSFVLVLRASDFYEAYQDPATHLIWGSVLDPFGSGWNISYEKMKNFCQSHLDGQADVSNLEWRLPSVDDFTIAAADHIRDSLSLGNRWLATSNLGPGSGIVAQPLSVFDPNNNGFSYTEMPVPFTCVAIEKSLEEKNSEKAREKLRLDSLRIQPLPVGDGVTSYHEYTGQYIRFAFKDGVPRTASLFRYDGRSHFTVFEDQPVVLTQYGGSELRPYDISNIKILKVTNRYFYMDPSRPDCLGSSYGEIKLPDYGLCEWGKFE